MNDALDGDATLYGAGVTTFSPTMVEVYGDLGLDFVWVDLEHAGPSPSDSEALASLTRAADVANVDLVVRLPSGDPPLIRKVLDAGVRTIVLPRVETAAEVERATEAARFTYDGHPGERGVGIGRANVWGGEISETYPDREDASVAIGAMIEHRRAIECVDDILAVPGLDFAFLGHYDLAVSFGTADPDDPRVQERIATYRAACRNAGLPFGRNVSAPGPDVVADAEAAGYRLLLVGNDVDAARRTFSDLLESLGDDH